MTSIGIFRPTPNNGLSFRFRKTEKPRTPDPRKAAAREKMDRIAEAFAEGAETARDAAKITNIPERTVMRLWGQIKRELGAQAV